MTCSGFCSRAQRHSRRGRCGRLEKTRDFFEISHPLAPQEPYLEAIQRRLLLGYQHHGFPEARIEARADARGGRVVVTVEEGPRYVCGGIKVSGAREVPATVIIERLTSSPAPGPAARRSSTSGIRPQPPTR